MRPSFNAMDGGHLALFNQAVVRFPTRENRKPAEPSIPRSAIGNLTEFRRIWVGENRYSDLEGAVSLTEFYPSGAGEMRYPHGFKYGLNPRATNAALDATSP